MNKNTPKESRERERERVLTVLCEKNMDWIVEMISNSYKIKWKEEDSKYRKKKKMKEV